MDSWLTPTPIQQLLLDILEFITSIVSWVGDIADLYISTPVLTLTVAFVVVGFAVGIFGRLLSRG